MGRTYDVDTRSVTALFSEGRQYRIPDFQRPFAWGRDQVSQYFEDVFDTSEGGRSHGESYFLGSIVLADEAGRLSVLDGQQRLTTLALHIAVIRDELMKLADSRHEKLERLLREDGFTEGPDGQVRIVLQQPDRAVFEELLFDVEKCELARFKGSALASAMATVRACLQGALQSKSGEARAQAAFEMGQRLLSGVEVVTIAVPSYGHAFRLFETLNDRGLPLKAADLIKNKLLARSGDHVDRAREYWSEVTKLVRDKEITGFLRHYWIAFHGNVSKQRLYDAYKEHLETLNARQTVDFARRLRERASVYASLVKPKSDTTDTEQTLRRLGVYRAVSCRSLLLLCAVESEPELSEVARLCEAAVVRYTFSDLLPAALDKVYVRLCSELRGQGRGFQEYAAFALRQILPPDDAFRQRLAQSRHKVSARVRQILLSLNEACSSGETRVNGPRKVHVEHVLPRKPSDDALQESQLSADEASELCGRIGNLTLLHGRINTSISNRAYSHKRPELAKSEIALTKEVAANDNWGRDEIETRCEKLGDLAIQVWSLPGPAEEASAAE